MWGVQLLRQGLEQEQGRHRLTSASSNNQTPEL